jgi:hypothetical protein
MEKDILLKELRHIADFLFDEKHYTSAGQVSLAIDTIDDLLSNKELYGYEDTDLHEVRKLIRKTIDESK